MSIRSALKWSETIEHVGSICHALDNAVLLASYQRNVPLTADLARRLRDLADANDLPEVRAKSLIFSGWCLAREGSLAEGLRELEAGLNTQQEVGTDEDQPVYCGLWTDLLLRSNRPRAAMEALETTIASAQTQGNLVWLPELYRMRAVTRRLHFPDRAAWQSDLERAADLADSQGAATLAARARAEMDRLQRSESP